MTAARPPSRWQRWWLARLPRTDHLTLHQRNVYIVPTRPGFMLAATLLVLLVTSINYQLNLGYLLTFLLAGSAVAGMHVGHGTLRGLILHLSPPPEPFAGTEALLRIQLVNERRAVRHGIGLAQHGTGHWTWADVPGQGTSVVQLPWSAPSRGWHDLPVLTAETRFPLGTFRVWALWRPAARVLVYPAPEHPTPPLAPQPSEGEGTAPALRQDAGEYEGIRPYQRGDTQRQIAWRKSANALESASGELISRDRMRPRQSALWLDWTDTRLSDPERRLSRLCAWVLQADEQGRHYGLRLPGREVVPGSGEAHRRTCLEALATW